MKHLPNLLSAARIPLSLLLPWLPGPRLLLLCYLLCGLTDILDGYLARRLSLESPRGALLDSAADAVFWAVVAALLLSRTDLVTAAVAAALCAVVVLRGLNLCITRVRFGRWGMLHSRANKAAGLLLFVLLPVCAAPGRHRAAPILLLFLAAIVSALEETAILLRDKRYNPNRKSFFSGD